MQPINNKQSDIAIKTQNIYSSGFDKKGLNVLKNLNYYDCILSVKYECVCKYYLFVANKNQECVNNINDFY